MIALKQLLGTCGTNSGKHLPTIKTFHHLIHLDMQIIRFLYNTTSDWALFQHKHKCTSLSFCCGPAIIVLKLYPDNILLWGLSLNPEYHLWACEASGLNRHYNLDTTQAHRLSYIELRMQNKGLRGNIYSYM